MCSRGLCYGNFYKGLIHGVITDKFNYPAPRAAKLMTRPYRTRIPKNNAKPAMRAASVSGGSGILSILGASCPRTLRVGFRWAHDGSVITVESPPCPACHCCVVFGLTLQEAPKRINSAVDSTLLKNRSCVIVCSSRK